MGGVYPPRGGPEKDDSGFSAAGEAPGWAIKKSVVANPGGNPGPKIWWGYSGANIEKRKKEPQPNHCNPLI
jgi:hypothetical protein